MRAAAAAHVTFSGVLTPVLQKSKRVSFLFFVGLCANGMAKVVARRYDVLAYMQNFGASADI